MAVKTIAKLGRLRQSLFIPKRKSGSSDSSQLFDLTVAPISHGCQLSAVQDLVFRELRREKQERTIWRPKLYRTFSKYVTSDWLARHCCLCGLVFPVAL